MRKKAPKLKWSEMNKKQKVFFVLDWIMRGLLIFICLIFVGSMFVSCFKTCGKKEKVSTVYAAEASTFSLSDSVVYYNDFTTIADGDSYTILRKDLSGNFIGAPYVLYVDYIYPHSNMCLFYIQLYNVPVNNGIYTIRFFDFLPGVTFSRVSFSLYDSSNTSRVSGNLPNTFELNVDSGQFNYVKYIEFGFFVSEYVPYNIYLTSFANFGYFNESIYNAYVKGNSLGNLSDSGSSYREGFVAGKTEGLTQGYNNGFTAGKAEGTTEGYNNGFTAGETEGYSNGFSEGKTEGLSQGYTNGFTAGKSEGTTEGYNNGFTAGKSEGLTEGFESGKSEGLTEGYDEGYEAGKLDSDYGEGYNQAIQDLSYGPFTECTIDFVGYYSNGTKVVHNDLVPNYVYLGINTLNLRDIYDPGDSFDSADFTINFKVPWLYNQDKNLLSFSGDLVGLTSYASIVLPDGVRLSYDILYNPSGAVYSEGGGSVLISKIIVSVGRPADLGAFWLMVTDTSVSDFNEGYNSGYDVGYAEGKYYGEKLGYDKGHSDGFQDGFNVHESGSFSWLVSSVQQFLNTKFFGDFGIGTLLYVCLGVVLVMYFLRLVAGG